MGRSASPRSIRVAGRGVSRVSLPIARRSRGSATWSWSRGIGAGGRGRDRSEPYPEDVIAKMAPLGLLGGPVPEKYGGIGIDYVSHALVTEEIGRVDSSVRTTLSVQISLVELTILKFGTEDQKQRWLPRLCKGELIGCFGLTEPEVGSDATSFGRVLGVRAMAGCCAGGR